MNTSSVIKYPLMTEKCLDLADRENRITFITHVKASKPDIKDAVEKLFNVEVSKVNTQITMRGEKKAFVKLKPDYSAEDIMGRMGVI